MRGTPELSEGTKARSNRCSRPLAKSGLDLAIEVQGPGLGIGGRTRRWSAVSCRLRSSVVSAGLTPSSFGRPGLVLRDPTPERLIGSLDPAWCSGPPRRFEIPGQRAGPTRLKFPVSRDFRAAVSLGLITFAPMPGSGKRSETRDCGWLWG